MSRLFPWQQINCAINHRTVLHHQASHTCSPWIPRAHLGSQHNFPVTFAVHSSFVALPVITRYFLGNLSTCYIGVDVFLLPFSLLRQGPLCPGRPGAHDVSEEDLKLLILPNAGITGMYLYTLFMWYWGWNPDFLHAGQVHHHLSYTPIPRVEVSFCYLPLHTKSLLVFTSSFHEAWW